MYKTGIIYKIVCDLDESFCYIGSTTYSLSDRFNGHKYDYKTKRKIMCTHQYFDKYGIENFKIIEIKKYLVCDKKHLHAYELLHILNNNCINSIKPFNPLTKLDKEKISQDKKKYYEKNKKKINEKKSKKITCECGSIFRYSDIARHKKTKKHQNYISRANMVSN